LACSPVLFATYLDYLLKKSGLLKYKIYAYADDIVFCLDSLADLHDAIDKLEGLVPDLVLNKSKSAIIPTNRRFIKDINELRGFPVVDSDKFSDV
jgi:hypothetical protein